MLNCNRKNYSVDVDISNQQHKCSNNKKKKNLISTFKRMCKKKCLCLYGDFARH